MPVPSPELYPSPSLFPEGIDPFSQGVLGSLAPWGARSQDWLEYNAALGSMFDFVMSLVSPSGYPDEPTYIPAWSTLLDPDNCPTAFIPFLAQFNGTAIPTGTSEGDARGIVKREAGFQRGTPAAIVAAAERFLTTGSTPTLMERTAADAATADPYHFCLVVDPAAITDIDSLIGAVNAVKPGGLQWTLIEASSYIWGQQIRTWAADTRTWTQAAHTL